MGRGVSRGHRNERRCRSGNAVAWVDENKQDRLTNMVDSMRRRLRALVRSKGARAGY